MARLQFSTSTVLFTKDDSVTQWYSAIDHIGARDQALQLMRHASYLIPSLNKAEKYFHLKEDYEYSFLWLMYVVRELASIEVILHNEAPRARLSIKPSSTIPNSSLLSTPTLLTSRKRRRPLEACLTR